MFANFRRLARWAIGDRPKTFDQQYRDGHWEFLSALPELAHYSVVAGYCAFVRARSILDVGCGNGTLGGKLQYSNIDEYLGIDYSIEAINQANAQNISRKFSYYVADARKFVAAHQFEVIIFNEVLYSIPYPRRLLDRYSRYLTPEGLFIVSIHSTQQKEKVWSVIERDVEVVDQVSVRHGGGTSWSIKLLRPRRHGG